MTAERREQLRSLRSMLNLRLAKRYLDKGGVRRVVPWTLNILYLHGSPAMYLQLQHLRQEHHCCETRKHIHGDWLGKCLGFPDAYVCVLVCHASLGANEAKVATLFDKHLKAMGNHRLLSDEGMAFEDTESDSSDSALGEFDL